jgi:hypothetical protein
VPSRRRFSTAGFALSRVSADGRVVVIIDRVERPNSPNAMFEIFKPHGRRSAPPWLRLSRARSPVPCSWP